jgi:hypothetical protein
MIRKEAARSMTQRRRRSRASSAKAFLGSISPISTKSFKRGLTTRRSEARKAMALSMAGGALGGATIVPGALAGVQGGIKGFATRGIRGIAPGVASGAVSPYKTMVNLSLAQRPAAALRAGKKLTTGQTRRLQRALQHTPSVKTISRSTAKELQKQTRLGLAQTGFAISASGALGGMAAYKQFSLGQQVREAKRRR